MTTPTTQFAPSGRLGLYEPMHQMSMWEDTFDGNISPDAAVCMINDADSKIDDKIEYTSDKSVELAEDSRASRSISEKVRPPTNSAYCNENIQCRRVGAGFEKPVIVITDTAALGSEPRGCEEESSEEEGAEILVFMSSCT